MEPIYGNHIGIVVNSNPDPEGRGRVQIFVPYLSTTLYHNWNNIAKDVTMIQGSLAGIPNDVLSRLQQNLPWAECAFPLFGAGGTTYADPSTGLTRPSHRSTAPTVDTSGRNALNQDDKTAPSVSGQTGEIVKGSGGKQLLDIEGSDKGDQNMIRYLASLGFGETEFNPKSLTNIGDNGYTVDSNGNKILANPGSGAYNSNVYQAVKKGMDIDSAVSKYGDFGYYKINNEQIQAFQKKTQSDIDPTQGSAAEQTQKMAMFMDVMYPTQAEAIRNGNFDEANKTLNKVWFGLPGSSMFNNFTSERKNIINGIQNGNSAADYVLAKSLSQTPPMVNDTGAKSTTSKGARVGKVLDSTRPLPSPDMRNPNGINSVPLPGTYVWCFFLGGDVQRPVYFAGVSERNSYARNRSVPSSFVQPGTLANTLASNTSRTSSGALVSGGVFNTIGINPTAGLPGSDFADILADTALVSAESNGLLGNGKERNGGRCLAGVKTALTDIGVFDSYPHGVEFAKDAGSLYEKAGLSNVSTDLTGIQKGDILVYSVPNDPSAAGHTEIVAQDKSGKTLFVSDKVYQNAASVNDSKYTLTGIYRKTT